MNTATKMLTFLIATTMGSTAMAAANQHSKALPAYNHTPIVQLDVQGDFSEEEIQRFADVQQELSTIQQNFSARIDEAPNVATQQALQRQSNERVMSAIEKAGFTAESYSRMAFAAESDPAVRASVQENTSMNLPVDMMYGTRYVLMPSEDAPLTNKVRAEFSEESLESYAEVQDDLRQIRDNYSDKIEKANDKRDAVLLRHAKQDMAEALQDVGLNREEYANISLALETDPKLREHVEELIDQSS